MRTTKNKTDISFNLKIIIQLQWSKFKQRQNDKSRLKLSRFIFKKRDNSFKHHYVTRNRHSWSSEWIKYQNKIYMYIFQWKVQTLLLIMEYCLEHYYTGNVLCSGWLQMIKKMWCTQNIKCILIGKQSHCWLLELSRPLCLSSYLLSDARSTLANTSSSQNSPPSWQRRPCW